MIGGMLLAIALQQLSSPQLARWQDLGGQDGQHFAVDPQSVIRAGTRMSVNIRFRTQDEEGPVETVVRYSYDCSANTVTRETADAYDGAGRFVGTITTPQPSRAIPALSIHATVRDAFCGTAP